MARLFFSLLFWICVFGVIWLGLQADHFWSRQEIFVHYTDFFLYWLGVYAKRCSSESFFLKPLLAEESQLQALVDDSLDYLEDQFGITEQTIFFEDELRRIALCAEGSSSFVEWKSLRLSCQNISVQAKWISRIDSGSLPVHDLRFRKQCLPLVTGIFRRPVLFCAARKQVPNVVPLLSFRRAVFRNHAEPIYREEKYRRSRRNVVSKINHQSSLLALLLEGETHLDQAVVADLACSFEAVSISLKSPVAAADYRSFLRKHAKLYECLTLEAEEEEEEGEEKEGSAEFLFGVVKTVGRELVATCSLHWRRADECMQVTSLVFDEETRAGLVGLDAHWSAIKSLFVAMMIQQMQLLQDADLGSHCRSAWIVDDSSDGLRFLQSRAADLLSLSFQTNVLPSPLFQLDKEPEELCVYVSNLYIPLSQTTLYTTIAM